MLILPPVCFLRLLRLFAARDFPSKRWRDLILRVWHVDPLRCPVCQNPMRVIAVIDDPRVAEKILRHLGAWHDPPAGLSSPGSQGHTPTSHVGMWTRCPTTRTCSLTEKCYRRAQAAGGVCPPSGRCRPEPGPGGVRQANTSRWSRAERLAEREKLAVDPRPWLLISSRHAW